MDDAPDSDLMRWRTAGALLAGLAVVVVVASMFTGTQVSGILSTVGAPVGIPGQDYPIGRGDSGGHTGGDTGGGTSGGSGEGSGQGGGSDPGGGDGSGPGGGTSTAGLVDGARPDLLIIKTGEIVLETLAVGQAIDDVTRRIVALGGYVSASERSRDGGDQASITFRIPADRWEDALAAARGVGDEVLDEHSTTQDVTGEVVDLRARIRNLQATEQAFQAIMARAKAIDDILAVQSELTEVRGQIEQLTATAARLEEQASLSTLKVVALAPDVDLPAAERAYDPGVEVAAATDRFVENAEALTTAGIWFGIVWLPILVVLTIAVTVGTWLVRRVLRLLGDGRVLEATSDAGR